MCQQRKTNVSTKGNKCVNKGKQMCQQRETNVSTKGNKCLNKGKQAHKSNIPRETVSLR